MRRWSLLILRLLAASVLGVIVLRDRPVVPIAQAADLWTVQAGGDREMGTISLNAFLPSTLTVHVGDTVNWTFATQGTPHTISFLAGTPPPPLIGPGPGPGELALGPVFFPIPPGPPQTEATFAGTQPVSSGDTSTVEGGNFRVTFTTAGTFAYACLIHPGMNGMVTVQPAGAALAETPQQAQARGQAQAESLLAQVQASAAMVQSVRAGAAGGPTTHTVAAGISNLAGPGTAGGASALQFLPRTLTVRRGDTVVWMDADPLEIHTVTLTSGGAEPEFVDVRPGPMGAAGPPLLVIPANVAGPVGGSSYTGQGYANSGIFGTGGGYALTIDAPAGAYQYLCLIHAGPDGTGMRGTITVTE
jgi:plastocyanin